jgi:hypothetical protein
MNDGLGYTRQKDWPTAIGLNEQPIARLKPKSELHKRVLNYLQDRIKLAERRMSSFYDRWNAAEKRVQAYLDLEDYEQVMKEMNDEGKPPKIISIQVPYSFSTISTIVTYMLHTFAGQRPIFQVAAQNPDATKAAHYMESLLQYNADYVRMVKKMNQWFMDAEVFGVGVLKTLWKDQHRKVTSYKEAGGFLGMGKTKQKMTENKLTWQGTEVDNIDPFMFLPDPRVPMHEVNRRGEFVFWKTYEGLHTLKKAEAVGQLHYVSAAGDMKGEDSIAGSLRDLVTGGEAHPGRGYDEQGNMRNFVQVTQGTIEIIPAELGLADREIPEKWLFSIGNGKQILQAVPFTAQHDMHPVCVIEPYSVGYGFGQLGIADYLGPLQDTMSWFINSHIYNVRAALNNQLVVDPSMINMKDLENPEPGKLIRLKQTAFGMDVRQAIQQLPVMDITRAHVTDLKEIYRMADNLSAATDNLRGQQQGGGRKTATEVRASGEAAASRLAKHAKLISAQGVVDLAEQMSFNAQQFMTEEVYVALVGQEAMGEKKTIQPDQISGSFYFPIHDGTLPLDRIALIDVWKEIFITISQNPNLTQSYDVGKIFEWIAEISGAKNLSKFKIQQQLVPDQQLQQQAQAGNSVPLASLGQGPGARLAGGNYGGI